MGRFIVSKEAISSLPWLLPVELRRALFRGFRAQLYRELQLNRTGESSVDWFSIAPFDQMKCIFVHIPKCAGKSVSDALFGKFTGHFFLRQYQLIYSTQEYADYYKFTFVRNPWDRVVSAYEFLKAGGLNNKDRMWAEQNLSSYEDFNSFCLGWLNRENARTSQFFHPQYEFICLGNCRTPGVDFVGYFENLRADFDHVSRRLGLSASLPHVNRSKRKVDFREYYTPVTRQIVADVYREDIEILGYDFDNRSLENQLKARFNK